MTGKVWGSLIALAVGTSGCATHAVGFVPIAAVTVRVAPDQEADVVWLIKAEAQGQGSALETILRCHNTDQGPICVPAKVSQ